MTSTGGVPAADDAQGTGVQHRVRIEAVGSSTDEAMSALPPFYDGSTWDTTSTGADYAYRYAAIGDADSVTLRTSRMRGRLAGDIPPNDDVIVQWFVGGSGVVDRGRDEIPMGVGQPQLFPTDRPFVFDFTDYDQRLVHLNRALVETTAAERFAFRRGALRFDHRIPPTEEAVSRWRRAVSATTAALNQGPVAPLQWAEVSRALSEAFLELYPPVAELLPAPLLLPKNAHIRGVVDHIHEHAHLPLTTDQLARLANVSPRALQDGFRRTVGSTPLEYLRSVRLDRVRAELTALSPQDTTVADVARRWGFAHMGRFSALYRGRFGEYARDTLHA